MSKQVALAINGGPRVVQKPLPDFKNASGRSLGDEELQELRDVLDSGALAYICGTKVGEFERAFASAYGAKFAVSASSGTAALHIALLYLNPEPGDEVIMSPITDMGAAIPVMAQLAIPVFVDVRPEDQNIDPQKIEAAISSRTKAIMVTHIYGNPADMDAIMAIARKHNLFVIEDCAQAHLTRYKGQLVGTLGHLGCFSFQQSKHMTTGDGGMVISNEDSRFGRELRLCMDKAWPRSKGGRDHLFLAPNYHMTELQAAVGLAQLRKLPRLVEARRRAGDRLSQLLSSCKGVRAIEVDTSHTSTYFFYSFTVDLDALSVKGAEFVSALNAEGVSCFLGYPGKIPLYKYPVIKNAQTFGSSGLPFTLAAPGRNWNYDDNLCPNAERLCQQTVCLWWNEKLSDEHVDEISAAIHKVADAFAD